MQDWIVEVRDSDGNDCTVYDYLVSAETADEARNSVFDSCMADAPEGTEEDGDFGTYYQCDCECSCTNCKNCGNPICAPNGSDGLDDMPCQNDAHDADCDGNKYCDGHGGFMVGEPIAYTGTEHAYYHSRVDLRAQKVS